MNIDKKTARTLFEIAKHGDSYEIKGFANVVFRSAPGKGSGYEYYFGSDRTPREIVIPDQIDELPVTKVAVKCLPDEAIVFCRGDLYPKLTRGTKASTARTYLEDPTRFDADEAEQIKAFIKKYSDDAANALCGSTCVEAYARLLALTKVKAEMIEKLLAGAEGSAEIKAILLNQTPRKKEAEPLFFDAPRKITAAEFKKLWTYREYTSGETGEKVIELSNYKGVEEHVFIPAMLGKKKIITVNGVFPPSVKSIEFEDPDVILSASFRNCSTMADENGYIVVQVGPRAVLTDYIGSKDVETLRIPDGVTENQADTFRNVKCRKAVFPEGFEKLARGTFSDCDHLQSVVLPSGLKEIGQLAFSGCVSLLELYIPASVETIAFHPAGYKNIVIWGEPGSAALAYAQEHGIPYREGKPLQKELSPFVISNGTLIRYCGREPDVIVPAGINAIDWMAFQDNTVVQTLVIPEGVDRIENFSFKNCSSLIKVTLPESLQVLDSYAFLNCSLLREVVFLGHPVFIGDSVFDGCRSLGAIDLPDGLEHIGKHAFSACFALHELHVPGSVTEIGEYAFMKQQRMTIHAPAGSYAEQYAKENDIPFVVE